MDVFKDINMFPEQTEEEEKTEIGYHDGHASHYVGKEKKVSAPKEIRAPITELFVRISGGPKLAQIIEMWFPFMYKADFYYDERVMLDAEIKLSAYASDTFEDKATNVNYTNALQKFKEKLKDYNGRFEDYFKKLLTVYSTTKMLDNKAMKRLNANMSQGL